MEILLNNQKRLIYFFNFILLLFSLISCKINNKLNFSKLQINGHRINSMIKSDEFNLIGFELVSTSDGKIKEYKNGESIILVNQKDELVFFNLTDSNFLLSDLELNVGLSKKQFNMLYPKQVLLNLESTKDVYQDEMIRLFDKHENELRVYFKNNLISGLSFLIFEDPDKWEDQKAE